MVTQLEVIFPEPKVDPAIEAVRSYWNQHTHPEHISRHPVGTPLFFEEIEKDRWKKRPYISRRLSFDGFMGKSVLEVGCGIGNDLVQFSRSGARVTGIDLSEKMIGLARQNFSSCRLKGDLVVMNGEDMTFPDNTFDVVYAHHVISFTPSPEKMMSEIFRVLKPGGTIILVAVNRHSLMRGLSNRLNIKLEYAGSPLFRMFSPKALGDLVRAFYDVDILPERGTPSFKAKSGWLGPMMIQLARWGMNGLPFHWVGHWEHYLWAVGRKPISS